MNPYRHKKATIQYKIKPYFDSIFGLSSQNQPLSSAQELIILLNDSYKWIFNLNGLSNIVHLCSIEHITHY